MSDLSFKVAKRGDIQPITFDLEGDEHVYTFQPPKQAVMFMPVLAPDADDEMLGINLTKSSFQWLDAGLSKSDSDRIEARLRNPEDDLDFDTLGEVVKGLVEHVGARPTT